MRYLGLFAVFVALSILLVGCPASSPILSFVPDGAVAVIQIKNPAAFLLGTEHFLQPFFDKNQSNLAQVLKDWERKSLFPVSDLDLTKPAGAAVLALPQGQKPLQAVLFFALKDPQESYQRVVTFLQKNQKKGPGLHSVLKGDYVVLLLGFSHLPVLPVEHPFDLSDLKTPISNGVDAYINLKAVEKDLLPHGETWAELTRQTIHAVETGPTSLPWMGVVVEKALNYLGAIKGLTLSMSLNAQGLAVWGRTHLTPGSAYLKFAQNLMVTGSREFWKYQDTKALLSLNWNLPPSVMETWISSLDASFLKAMGATDTTVKEVLKSQEDLLETEGPRGVLNLDVDLDAQELRQALSGKTPNLQGIANAFNVRITGVQETRDSDAYKKALRSFYSSSVLPDLVTELGQRSLKGISFGVRMAEDLQRFGLVYDRAQVWARIADSSGIPEVEKINKFFSGILDNLPIYLHYSPTRVYFTTGKEGLTDLNALVQQDAVSHNWATSNLIASWSSLFPESSLVEVGVSINKIFSLVKKSGSPQFVDLPEVVAYPDLLVEVSPTPSGDWESAIVASLSEDKPLIRFFSENMKPFKARAQTIPNSEREGSTMAR